MQLVSDRAKLIVEQTHIFHQSPIGLLTRRHEIVRHVLHSYYCPLLVLCSDHPVQLRVSLQLHLRMPSFLQLMTTNLNVMNLLKRILSKGTITEQATKSCARCHMFSVCNGILTVCLTIDNPQELWLSCQKQNCMQHPLAKHFY